MDIRFHPTGHWILAFAGIRTPLHSSLRRKPESSKEGLTETLHVYSIMDPLIKGLIYATNH